MLLVAILFILTGIEVFAQPKPCYPDGNGGTPSEPFKLSATTSDGRYKNTLLTSCPESGWAQWICPGGPSNITFGHNQTDFVPLAPNDSPDGFLTVGPSNCI